MVFTRIQPKPSRYFVPEVVQTSAMDCGPAALKALLEGFNIPISYGRLREACQTSVDGTSIDTLEEIAQQLGLNAHQIMLPADLLFIEECTPFPAIVVLRLPNGAPHFVVVWRMSGAFLQVMNPSMGRRWQRRESLLEELYIHTYPIPTQTWCEWAASDDSTTRLHHRLRHLGMTEDDSKSLEEKAQQTDSWLGWATLDAAVRLVDSLVRANALDRGAAAAKLVQQLTETIANDTTQALALIPAPFWSVQPDPHHPDHLLMRGAVLVSVDGLLESGTDEVPQEEKPPLPVELAAALSEKERHPFAEIWRLLRQDGFTAPGVLLVATLLSALGVTIEALLLRGILQASAQLIGVEMRTNAILLIALFGLLMLLIEYILADALTRMGRHLDMRLRIAFLSKLPRLSDRYFQSRLISDMTTRAHDLAAVKTLPALAVQFLQLTIQLILTTLGVIYFVPDMFWLALVVLLLALLPSLLARPLLQEQDLRYRTHSSALSRFYLDGLLGLIPLRTHSAEGSLQNAHEMLLSEWFQAGRTLNTFNLWLRGVQTLLSTLSVILILTYYIHQGGASSNILLLFYWTLNLPVLGQSISNLSLQYPQMRNRVLRILEPLGAPDENGAPSSQPVATSTAAAAITLQAVDVVAGGHTILSNLNLTIKAGEHIAIVGPSGAGKSSLVGLLLGWYKPANGTLLVDDQPLQNEHLEALRRQSVWVDPAVHLWNRSLLENLEYGNLGNLAIGDALDEANLYDVLQRLPNGLQTELGEGGGLVSGGEGQRVRLGRGYLRSNVRLVILDEPFRGLDRTQRQALLRQSRQHWHNATLLFISHDVGDTHDFDRVLVVENGAIVEDAAPATLAQQAESSYRKLLDAEAAVRHGLWESTTWRRLWLAEGVLKELPTNS